MNTTSPVAQLFRTVSKKFALSIALSLLAVGQSMAVEVIAFDLVESGNLNLISRTNAFENAFASAGDGFQVYRRGVSPSIPFAVLDDSLTIFPADTLGIIDETNTDEFFGAVDTINSDNPSGPVTASWLFDISGGTDLSLSIDMGAMGDFEAADVFTWTYSIDGGPVQTAFEGVTDESGSLTYTLADGDMFTLNDPMTVDGVTLSNDLTTLSTALAADGSELTLTLTMTTNGGSEAFAFQNIQIIAGAPGIAFDLVNSDSLNLISFTNPFDGAFSSAADGFQVYQRGVSGSIPFAVLDDSLTFAADSLGIIKTGNTDTFFGIVDTQNGDNDGPVSATWVFDITGGEGLGLSIDMGAMGDFESSDNFTWSYSIDGGPIMTAFTSTIDEAGSFTYTLEDGDSFTLNDPLLIQGEVVNNDLTTFSTPLSGTGTTLELILTAIFNGGSEAVAFQNIVIGEGFTVEPTPVLEIHEIQGDGAVSPFNGSLVESLDNVVTALGTDGFYIQTPTARSDFNPDTSDGIFVFTDATPTVAVGDQVDVLGTVNEFFGFTEFSDDTVINFDSAGNVVPDPVVFDTTVPSPNPAAPSCAIEFECYEGMVVHIANGAVTASNQGFGTDPVAEVFITAAPNRTFREPGIAFPGDPNPSIPTWDGNPEVFELDPDKLGLPNQIIPAGSSFSATGVIGFEFGGYELWPTELSVTPATLPVAVRAKEDDELTVGSLNVFRLFNDVDDPSDMNGQGGTRDDAVVSTEEYDRRRGKVVDYVMNVLHSPDILGIQEIESLSVLEDVAADIAAADSSINYSAHLIEGNDIGTIDVGFLVRDHITVDGVTQFGIDEILSFDGSLLNDRPPLLLEARANGAGDFGISVIVVHGRSLGGIETPRTQVKRLEQAQFLAGVIQDLQTEDPDRRIVVTGDFNAFEFTDGFVDVIGQISGTVNPAENTLSGDDLVNPDLINQVLSIPEEQRYSFIFRGNAQVLDHALTSSALDMSVRGLEYGRGNADAAVDLINDPSTPLRSADHDGLVLYIDKDLDDDGVNDDADFCPATVIPEATLPTARLRFRRYALTDDDTNFDTFMLNIPFPVPSFTTLDTGGCSCEQIIDELGLPGSLERMFGCSVTVMEDWIALINAE